VCGNTIPKIDISPYLSEKSSNFDEILYTAADFELDERHVIKNEDLHWTDSEFDRTYFLFQLFHRSKYQGLEIYLRGH